MKYIIDIDALNDCLELMSQCKINGKPYISLETVKEIFDKFPKEEMANFIENLQRLGVIKT